MDIGSAAGIGQLTAHGIVKSRHNGLAAVVLQVLAIAQGNGGATGGADAEDIDVHAFVAGVLGGLHGTAFMVFAIGDDNDGLAYAFLLGEAMRGQRNGGGNVGALGGYQRGVDARKEHLGRNIVAGNGQLHEGIAGEDDEPYLVVSEVIYQILDHHLSTVQAAGRHVLGQHGVADVHTDDGLDARTLLVRNAGAHLGTRQHDDEQCQGS